MAYRQPKVPEYREGGEMNGYIRNLILFLKDSSGAAWTANNQRIREIEALQARLEALEAAQKEV